MVNVGFSWGSLIGIALAVAGAALYFLRSFKPGLARDYDIFFAAVGLLCGGILFFNSWRLDPILQFSQFLLTGSVLFFAYETIRLRQISTEQAKRAAPFAEDDRPVSRVYRAELDDDEVDGVDFDPPPRSNPRRIRGSEDPRDEYERGYATTNGRRRTAPTRGGRDEFDAGDVPPPPRTGRSPRETPPKGSTKPRRPVAPSAAWDEPVAGARRSVEVPPRDVRSRTDSPRDEPRRSPRRSGPAPRSGSPRPGRDVYADEPPAPRSSYRSGGEPLGEEGTWDRPARNGPASRPDSPRPGYGQDYGDDDRPYGKGSRADAPEEISVDFQPIAPIDREVGRDPERDGRRPQPEEPIASGGSAYDYRGSSNSQWTDEPTPKGSSWENDPGTADVSAPGRSRPPLDLEPPPPRRPNSADDLGNADDFDDFDEFDEEGFARERPVRFDRESAR